MIHRPASPRFVAGKILATFRRKSAVSSAIAFAQAEEPLLCVAGRSGRLAVVTTTTRSVHPEVTDLLLEFRLVHGRRYRGRQQQQDDLCAPEQHSAYRGSGNPSAPEPVDAGASRADANPCT